MSISVNKSIRFLSDKVTFQFYGGRTFCIFRVDRSLNDKRKRVDDADEGAFC